MGSILHKFIYYYQIIKVSLIYRVLLLISLIMASGFIGIFLTEYKKNPAFSSPIDIFYFMITTMTTVGFGDKVPLSNGGKIIIILVIVSSVLMMALLSALTAAYIIESKLKEELGMNTFNYKKHIVILGWNIKGETIVNKLLDGELERKTKKIIIVADVEKNPLSLTQVSFVKTEHPSNSSDLQRAAIQDAEAIIVLADYGVKTNSDAMTTINCLLARKANPEAEIIVEMLNPASREYFEFAGANQIIGVAEIGSILLAGSCLKTQNVTNVIHTLGINH